MREGIPQTVDVRALAAQTLAAVAFEGASLREAVAPAHARLGDSRDRALLTALVNEGARWWLRFDVALDGLLERPLRTREHVLHALLVLGLVQIEILELPQHAAVAASVEAARALRRSPFANLVNAVLRRWLREREALNARLDEDPVTRHAFPRWLIDALTLGHHADVARLPVFREGRVSVQDGAAQLAADLLDVHEGMRVLDAC